MVCHSIFQWTVFCPVLISTHALLPLSTAGWHAWCPGCPTVGVCWTCLNLNWLLGVGQRAARSQDKGPTRVAGKGSWGKLEVMLLMTSSASGSLLPLTALGLIRCSGVTVSRGANYPPRSHWSPDVEAPILWPPDVERWLIGKDPDAGKDWRQEEKGVTENEKVVWHPWFNGHEFEQSQGDSDGQRSPVCCSSWGSQRVRHKIAPDNTTLTLHFFQWHHSHILK